MTEQTNLIADGLRRFIENTTFSDDSHYAANLERLECKNILCDEIGNCQQLPFGVGDIPLVLSVVGKEYSQYFYAAYGSCNFFPDIASDERMLHLIVKVDMSKEVDIQSNAVTHMHLAVRHELEHYTQPKNILIEASEIATDTVNYYTCKAEVAAYHACLKHIAQLRNRSLEDTVDWWLNCLIKKHPDLVEHRPTIKSDWMKHEEGCDG